jgi:hypothetical protein
LATAAADPGDPGGGDGGDGTVSAKTGNRRRSRSGGSPVNAAWRDDRGADGLMRMKAATRRWTTNVRRRGAIEGSA